MFSGTAILGCALLSHDGFFLGSGSGLEGSQVSGEAGAGSASPPEGEAESGTVSSFEPGAVTSCGSVAVKLLGQT